ncbi:MAG: ATP-binding domain-containing protein [Chlorobiaceae bacterium]|nr:ATP-binding domain-containing protein [Chlorobiaceae bacterium]
MARMMPSFFDETSPPGERDVFNMLSGGPEDWVILHSLDLTPWNRSLRTEIDFVVIVPDTGILCIEVKSHREIGFNGSHWTPVDIKRSPFKQVSSGRYVFYNKLRELAPRFRHVPVVCLCIFPNAFFVLQPNMSVAEWELMDTRAFRYFPNCSAFCRDLKRRMIESINADGNLFLPDTPLSANAVEDLVKFCIPVHKRRLDDRESIRHREQELEVLLTIQQKPVFRLAEHNERIIVSGGAGTGKSLVAFELARRYATSGERVVLLCFNSQFGSWITHKMEAIEPQLPNLVVGTIFRILARMTDISIPENADSNYWENVLPLLLEEKITDPDMMAMASFDRLIVDEAQDLLSRPLLMNCLFAFLTGGIKDGRYALFGDFQNQVLASRNMLNQSLERLEKDARPARWHLSENCRNYRIVAHTSIGLSGLDHNVYSGFLRVGGSIENFDIAFYSSDDIQAEILSSWLKEFRNAGYKPEDITILSFLSDERSLAGRGLVQAWHPAPLWQDTANRIRYGSVYAFKGLENKIVILTDVILTEQGFQRDLFYTGMTRATETIRILCHESSKKVLSGWMKTGGLEDE